MMRFLSVKKVGITGEEIAANFLKANHCRILFRNLRWRLGELDIVAREEDGVLIFVEVKTITNEIGFAERNFTYFKAHKTRRSAQLFLQKYPKLLQAAGSRIDLIAIKLRYINPEEPPTIIDLRWHKNVA